MAAFDDDFDAADDLLAEAFGGSITLRRGGSTTTGVSAQVIITDHDAIDDQSGMTVSVQSRDFLIRVEAYAFGGTAVEPRAGDVIVETVNGVECQFELMPIGRRPAFEWAAADGRRWIVRTKKVS